MKFSLDDPQGKYVFSNYGNGALTVNEQPHHSSLLIFPDSLQEWNIKNVNELKVDDFEPFIERRADIIILGTGAEQDFPSVELRRALMQKQIQLDIMDTAAACRTYNLLVSEDRNVGAAVIVF